MEPDPGLIKMESSQGRETLTGGDTESAQRFAGEVKYVGYFAEKLAETLGMRRLEIAIVEDRDGQTSISTGEKAGITEKAELISGTNSNWWALRKHIEGILGKVMGRAQLTMMIDRVLAKRGTPDPYRLSPADTRKLAIELIEQVPNTTKRQALMSELEAVLADHKL